MSKYDWSKVPKNIMWIATDSDRFQVWFESKPERKALWWNISDVRNDAYRCISPEFNQFKGDWKDSLEGRPE